MKEGRLENEMSCNIEVFNGWSYKSFDMLLELLRAAFLIRSLTICNIVLRVVSLGIRLILTEEKKFHIRSNHGRTRLLDKSSLTIIAAGPSRFYNDNTSSLSIKSQPTLESSQPLSGDEIYETVLGRRSGYSKGLGWGPRPKSRKTNASSSSTTFSQARKKDIEAANFTNGRNEEDCRRNESGIEGIMIPCSKTGVGVIWRMRLLGDLATKRTTSTRNNKMLHHSAWVKNITTGDDELQL
ncbi:NBS-LRR type resistance protein [Cucumis melo var. makuwa]|uniref:NBS-LRR type resistance protein n=1 Tax=Cucumis melo var. makuwa TaxID=1194695 RepID=A0A5D3DT75_CUCMM|nr:NBS-LRR type resistance protein [Cucumis melo var. makuwa]TYK26728.1 NBS-LRR type resistance protein [Cucumis melo var. makuwa]